MNNQPLVKKNENRAPLWQMLFFFAVISCAFGCSPRQEITVIKLAHSLDVNHSVHRAMMFLNDRLKAQSNGTMQLQIYPNQQLGTERQCLELLQIGSVGMTKVSVGVLENFAPQMKVFGIPFLFRDRNHADAVLQSAIGKELLLGAETYWLRGLNYYDAGSRSFYTTARPIYTPDDLTGLKIRVMPSATAVQMVKQLGGSPTPIAWGELYSSLQQGIVDGAENNLPSFYLARHYEVCKYYTVDEHTILPDVLLIATPLWNRLTPQQQQWLQTAADESAIYQKQLWAADEQEAMRAILEAGIEVIRPQKALFSAKVNKLHEQYKIDDKLYTLIQKIKNYHQ